MTMLIWINKIYRRLLRQYIINISSIYIQWFIWPVLGPKFGPKYMYTLAPFPYEMKMFFSPKFGKNSHKKMLFFLLFSLIFWDCQIFSGFFTCTFTYEQHHTYKMLISASHSPLKLKKKHWRCIQMLYCVTTCA